MKSLKAFFMPALSLLLPYLAIAGEEKTMIFEGAIGTYPILLSVTSDGSNCDGMYCYRKMRKDIRLEGTWLSATQVQLTTPDEKETFRFTLSPAGWAGKWSDKKGKQLDVKLKALDIAKVNHLYKDLPSVRKMRSNDPYAYVRTADLAVQNDTVTQQSGCRLQWYHLERSGVYSCSIISGYPDAILKKINALLLDAAIFSANDHYSCTSSFGEGEMNYDMSVSYMSPDVISIYRHEYYDCGGAHPDDAVQPLNINARTGQLLQMEDILWLGTGAIPKENSKAWYSYRDSIFAPKVVAMLRQYHAKEMDEKDPEIGNECTYGAEEYKFPEFYFTKDGLYLSPGIPHVMAPCREPEWSFLPFDEVKKHLRPGLQLQLP